MTIKMFHTESLSNIKMFHAIKMFHKVIRPY